MFRFTRVVVAIVILITISVSTGTGSDDQAFPYGKVELIRDTWGVPHVFADTDAGAMYGLGYAAAEDRGFQIYYFLRIIQGRTAEVFGVIDKKKTGGAGPNNTVEHDRRMRMFGFARAADTVVKNLDAESLQLLEAYSAGVNDHFAKNEAKEHYLFEKTGLEREPWKPADCIVSWWHFAQFFSKDGLRDYPSLTERAPKFRAPRVGVDDEAAVVRREDVLDEWVEKVQAWTREMGLVPDQQPESPDSPDPKFSHAWVVGGKKTTTGASVLVSDPQTPVWNPSVLYEFHAQGATFNARGIGVAGSPTILIGFNQHVAWGLTALGADQADIFVLKTDREHPDQYQVDGKWLDMNPVEEVIQVKEQESIQMTVKETIFGPVASEFVYQNPPGQEVALCRVPMVETDRETIQGAIGMMRARSCDEFAAALPGWRFPTANCVFGDSQGNIGYWTLGALPNRSLLTKVDGSHAQDGSTREGMWRGMVPYDILPHCINPKRGYLVTANHRTIQSFYAVPFGNMTGSAGDTDRGLRIKERIWEHLADNEQFAPEDVLSIHNDMVNVWKREIIRLGYRILETSPEDLTDNSRKTLEYLRPWYENGAATDLSIPGSELVNNMGVIFRGTTGVVAKYGGGVSGLARFAKTVSARDKADPNAPVPTDESEFVDLVLTQAWSRTEGAYGSDSTKWNMLAREGLCRQKLGYMESLDGFPSLDEGQDIALPLLKTIDGATVLSQRAQSYTQFVPLDDPDASLTIQPIGTSDDPRSPYRFSSYGDWAKGQLHAAPLSREAVNTLATSQQTLGPARAPIRQRTPDGRGVGREPAVRPGVRPGAERPVRGQPRERPGAGRGEQPRRPDAQPQQVELPGRVPDDPVIEGAIRYLNRQERTETQVQKKIAELRDFVKGDDKRKDDLVNGLERFIYIMRESQAGRIHIRYGTTETLRLVDAFYGELTDG